jgi:hypothetical protein
LILILFRNGKKVTKTETTTIDAKGTKKVEITEETGDGNTKKSLKEGFGDFGFDDDDNDDFGFGFGGRKKPTKKQLNK